MAEIKIINKSFFGGPGYEVQSIERRDHCYYKKYEGRNLIDTIKEAEITGYKTDRICQTAYAGNGGHISLRKNGEKGLAIITSEHIKAKDREGLFYTLYIPTQCTEVCIETARRRDEEYKERFFRNITQMGSRQIKC